MNSENKPLDSIFGLKKIKLKSEIGKAELFKFNKFQMNKVCIIYKNHRKISLIENVND
jgi:hypothetical protein